MSTGTRLLPPIQLYNNRAASPFTLRSPPEKRSYPIFHRILIGMLFSRCKRPIVDTTNTAPSALHHYAGLLAIELDPQQPDFTSVPPAPLNVAAATALARHLAKDLDRVLEGVSHLGLILPGALYDQTEVLRPGFPLTGVLARLYENSSCNQSFTPQLIALGTDHGSFPITAINPLRRPGSGPLLLLPFCFIGSSDAIGRLACVMEDTLLQSGDVSAATREAVQHAFGLTALNMSYATLGDLCALLRVQLEANDFLPLWELLEYAWFERSGIRRIVLDSGNYYLAEPGHIHTVFYTFDDWAQFGPGRALDAAELGAAYGRWAHTQRQYAQALEAYGLHTRRVLGNPQLEKALSADNETALAALDEQSCLSSDYLVEAIFHNDSENPERQMLITHQADPELGTLAYTVTTLDAGGQLLRLEHHYPLQPHGLQVLIDDLIRRCTEQGAERQVLHPGRLLYSESGRCLRAATESDLPTAAERTH